MKKNKHWFKQKRYGYGVTPKSWEGWLSLPVFAILILGGAKFFENDTYFYIYITIIALIFIGISKEKTKDPWEWRWGK